MKEKTKAYVAGMFDGDGYLGITHAPSQRRYQIEIVVSTTCRPLAKWLVKHFGGTFSTRTPAKSTHNVWYMWRLTGKNSQYLFLDSVKQYLWLKRKQATKLLEFLEIEGANKDLRAQLFEEVRLLNSTSSVETDTPSPISKTGRAYFAGFFDAEGCITMNGANRCLKVANTVVETLNPIRDEYGGHLGLLNNPKKDCYLLSISKRDSVKRFLQYSLPYLIVKRAKAKETLSLLASRKDTARTHGRP